MAIALDTSNAGTSGTATSINWNHTVSSVANNMVVIGVRSTSATTDNVTGATCGGVAMTKATGILGDAFLRRCNSIWFRVGCTPGVNNIIVSGTPSDFISGMSASYTGVKQTAQPDATQTAIAGSSPVTGTITTVADNSWVFAMSGNEATTPTANTGITFRQAGNGLGIGDSNAVVTPAGAYVMKINAPGAGSITIAMMSFSPALAVNTPASQGLMGMSNMNMLGLNSISESNY